jgi:hypothetical protein
MKTILPVVTDRLKSILLDILSLAKSRPAGSESEGKLKEYISNNLSNSGYDIQKESFSYPIIPRLYNAQLIESVLIILALILIRYTPLLGFLLPFIFSIVPVLMLEGIKLFPRKFISENVVATPKNTLLSDAKMLVVAHMDTAQTIPFLSGIPEKIISYCQRTLFIITFIIALQCVAVIAKITMTPAIVAGLNIFSITIALITTLYQLWITFFWHQEYSPGANDNASGVAVGLLIAETLSKQKTVNNSPIAFLFTSAEEQGLCGAVAFVKKHTDWTDKPVVLNLDSVACGNKLGLVIRYGRLVPDYTSKSLNNIIKEIDHTLVKISHFHRCGDYLPFYRSGFQVTSLEAVWNGDTPPEYHTSKDTPENLNLEIFSQAYQVTSKTIENFIKS